ncbi:MAG: preprotein translocase subunit SecG [Bacteroidaceae bacterium]|nr:preprotein translocase subunit SecG [Bacteroidaceae bacterium]
MYTVIVVVAVIVAVLLTFIVLIQESKGGGLASDFAASNQIMGVRKTTDFVEKATWTLAGLLVVLSVVTTYVVPRGNSSENVVTNMRTEAPAALPGQAQQGTQQQQAQEGEAQPAEQPAPAAEGGEAAAQ